MKEMIKNYLSAKKEMCELRKSRNEISIKSSERRISEVVDYIDKVLNRENWNLNFQNTR